MIQVLFRRCARLRGLVLVFRRHKSFLMGKEAVQALRGVTLEVMRGEIVCLMGPSGSGKTTLLNIIGGLEEPSRGHVIVDGENVVALSELTSNGFPGYTIAQWRVAGALLCLESSGSSY